MVIKKRHATELRRKEIIEATRKLIIKDGSEKLTIRAIAGKVGITQTAIYRHFKSKKEILLILADEIGKTLLADFNQNPNDNGAYLEALGISLHHHILGLIKSREGTNYVPSLELYRLHDKDLNEKIIEGIKNITGLYRELLSRGIESGEVWEDLDLDTAAMLIYSMMSGLVEIWAMDNHNFALEDKFATMWSVFRKGVAKR